MLIKDKLDEKAFYFNKILSKWIAEHSNINIESINQKKLLYFSRIILFVHDNWQEIIKYYPSQSKCEPSYGRYSALCQKLMLTLKTDIIYDFPKPRFFNITGYFRFLISSFKTTYILIKAIMVKHNIATTNKNIAESFNIKWLRNYDNLFLSDIYVRIKRTSARRKLKLFLSDNIVGFNIEILTKIIPSCLVELLPIYKNISSKLSITEIHTWVMDIHMSPVLLINCLFNKDIKVIGYQHGGGYGYISDEWVEAEMSFYDHFYYWGYSEETIHPFRFRKKNNEKNYSFYPNQKATKNINFFLDSFLLDYIIFADFKDIKNISTKLNLIGTNLNIVLHPNDYEFTKKKIHKSSERTKIYNSTKEIIFDSNAIYFVSIYSTLFWKIIDKKLCFICFKGNEFISLTKYHFNLSKLMEENNLIYKFNNFSRVLSEEFLNDIIHNNEKFYKEIYNL